MAKNDDKGIARTGEIVLRSTRGKLIVYKIQPAKDPETRMFPEHVRRVDYNGDMILLDSDKRRTDKDLPLIPENMSIEIKDGIKFNLANPMDAAYWYAIKNSDFIAESRDSRDEQGNLIIDGSKTRYGKAELYIERPEQEAEKRISRFTILSNALSCVLESTAAKRLNVAKLFGFTGANLLTDPEITEYLLSIAEKDPKSVIEKFTDTFISLQILVLDAKEAGVITNVSGIHTYGDTLLGSTVEAVVTTLKEPKNAKIKEMIEAQTYNK